MTGPPMIIAGGGIAGLSTAIAVAAAGNRVLVLERASGFAEMGAGIQLGPNAFHALRHLGIHDVLGARAVLIDELRLMDGTTGRCITTVPLGEAVQVRYAHPYAVVHRGDLYQALLDVARGHDAIELREGHPVRSYEQHPAGVTVALDDGRTLDGTALIGADGLHSVVRAQLLGDGDPCPVGHVTYRALVPADRMPADVRWNAATLWAGPRTHVVHYPIAAATSYNLVATRDNGTTERWAGRPVARDEVMAQFAHLAEAPRRVIAQAESWRAWTLQDREPVRSWAEGRVVLVGDAAHPMVQYAAQGACLALEDAVTLGVLLASGGEPAAAFQHFVTLRRDRAARVWAAARFMGSEIYHATGPAAEARQALFDDVSPEELFDRLDWLYGWRAPSADLLGPEWKAVLT